MMVILFLVFTKFLLAVPFEEYRAPTWNEISSESKTTKEMEAYERSKDFGNCICDLTYGQCDFNCLCDEDCSKLETSLFRGEAKPETGFVSKQTKCGALKPVISSLPSGVTYKHEPADPGVCVVYETNPSRGYYYDYVSEVDNTGDFDLAKNEYYKSLSPKEDPLTVYTKVKDSTTLDGSIGKYHASDVLPARKEIAGVFDTTNTNKFTIPVGINSGYCVEDAIFPKFMENIPPTTCSFEVSASTTAHDLCLTKFNATLYTSSIYIGKKPTAMSSKSEYVQVGVNSVNGVQGASMLYGKQETYGSVDYCVDGLRSVSYIITYNRGTMEVTGAFADITTANISSIMKSASLEVSVYFVGDGDKGDILSGKVQQKSGNPGYLPQTAVRSGKFVTVGGGKGVQQRKKGVEVPTSGTTCVSPLVTPSNMETTQVLFMEDISSSCTLTYTEAELKTNCASLGIYADNLKEEVIGQYGNSSMYNYLEWVEVIDQETKKTPFVSGEYCMDVPEIVNLEIVYVRSGPIRNMQWKIVGARRTFEYGNWRIPKVATRNYFFKFRVTFVEDVGGINYPTVAPIRSVLSIPKGWLYPINVVFGGSNQNFVITSFVILLCLSMLL